MFDNEDGIGLLLTPHAFDRFFEALKENDNRTNLEDAAGHLAGDPEPQPTTEPDSLAAGAYPGALIKQTCSDRTDGRSLALSNRLEQIVINRIDAPQEQARMRRVLSYWGDPERADTTMVEGELAFAGIRQAVFEAFGLPWIGASEASHDAAPRPSPSSCRSRSCRSRQSLGQMKRPALQPPRSPALLSRPGLS